MHLFCTQIHGVLAESTGLWDGKDGIVSKIWKDLKPPSTTNHRTIVKCLRLIEMCNAKGAQCSGEVEPRKEWSHHKIPLDSFDAQVTADMTEGGFGFTETTFFVN